MCKDFKQQQEDIIDFASKKGLKVVLNEDEDYITGSKWNDLLRDTEVGKVNIILCKTKSRFVQDNEGVSLLLADNDLQIVELDKLMEEHERMKEEMFKDVITQGGDVRSEIPETSTIYVRKGENQ